LVTFQQLHLPLFDIQPVLGRFREMMKRNAVERRELLRFPMIANYHRNVAGQLANLIAVEQVNQTMLIARNEDGDPQAWAEPCQPPCHLEFLCDSNEFLPECRLRQIKRVDGPFNPHEKSAGLIILMLVGMQDIGSMRVKELGKRRFRGGRGNRSKERPHR
jgi:hypothetical protein